MSSRTIVTLILAVIVLGALGYAGYTYFGTGNAPGGPRTDLRLGLALEPPSLDPTAEAATAVDDVVYQNVFEGLTRVDSSGAVQPALAKSWDISADNLNYTFHLATGVTFHDGSSFDADDVVFSFGRIATPDSKNAQKVLYSVIDSISKTDASTVVVKLKSPAARFLFDIGRGDAVIVAPESAATNVTKPIGTGPFKFVSWQKGADLTLERYDAYWGTKVALSKVTYVFITDATARTNALLAGTIDGINNTDTATLAVFAKDARFKVLAGATEGEVMLVQNNAKEPFSKLEVRQAIAHAIDRKEIIDGASSGYGVPIGSHFAPFNPYYVDLTGTYPFDLAKAKELLAAAGYPNGFTATIKVITEAPYAGLVSQILASQLSKIGITIKQEKVDFNQWLAEVYTKHDFELTVVSHSEPFDIGIYADPNYYFGYNDPDFQAIIKKLNETTDDAARKDLAIAAQKWLAEQAVNGFLYELPKTGVWNAKLEGMWKDEPIEGVVLTGVHWVQ
jgi:peptide/nickel transport system substrate-binding protein